ncbi:MAG: polysaccharide biosynthesis tyrosine autokinase [Alphaproteobacteria bacterium]|nr:polysaccharide biosynthesis tyrosine autokinase [Alphaproteobacteria bacterium]
MSFLEPLHARQSVLRREAYERVPVQYVGGPSGPPQQDLIDTVRRIWRHRFMVLAVTAAFAVVAFAVLWRLPSLYVGEAKVEVGVPAVQIFSTDLRFGGGDADTEKVENERIAMQSPELARTVIEQLRLADNPEFAVPDTKPSWWQRLLTFGGLFGASPTQPAQPAQPADAASSAPAAAAAATAAGPGQDTALDAAVPTLPVIPPDDPKMDRITDRLLSRVAVSVEGRSHVLDVDAESVNSALAANIANAFATNYLREQRGDKIKSTDRVMQYLRARIAQLREAVETSEKAAADYRRENGLYEGMTNANVTTQQLTELNTQLVQAQTEKATADAAVQEAEALRHNVAESNSTVPAVLDSPLIQTLKAQQAQAAQTLAEVSANYGPRYPAVIQARNQVADVSRKINAETARIVEGLKRTARTADARYAALTKNFHTSETQMGGVNEKAIRLEALERDATVNQNLLEAMLARAKETIGREQIETPDAKLITAAAPPVSPTYPPKLLIMLLSVCGGLFAGSLAALMRESTDHTFRRSDEIEQATGLPVIAMVPDLKGTTQPSVHVLRKPISGFSESLRKIYVGLQLSEAAQPPKTVMFSSATPGEGKSVLVASLARLLARNGKRIMLIDCDWRAPTLHRVFQRSDKNGLASLLADEGVPLSDVIYNDPLSGVDVIVSGGWNPHSMQLLTSARMRAVLQTFGKNYDLVILDTPPVLVGAEVLQLSRMVDKVIYTVRWGHTRREVALDGLKQLLEAGADIPGLVMSRVDAKRYREFAYSHLNYEYARPSLAQLGG